MIDLIDLMCDVAMTGDAIESMQFGVITDGHVYEDSIIRIAISDDRRNVEVFRLMTGNIIVDVSNGLIRRFSAADVLRLSDHINTLTKQQ